MTDRKKQKPQFVPCEEQRRLWPAVSGNVINGCGETQRRRPSPVYWHAPDLTPHGPLQLWMIEEGKKTPAVYAGREARSVVMARQPVPIAAERLERSAEQNTDDVKRWALESGAQLVGVAQANPEWVYQGYEFDYPTIVLFGIAMDYEQLSTAPDVPAALTVLEGYTNGWKVSQAVCDRIRQLGWRAEARSGPPAGAVSLVPAALAAGFGELGKHGSIINGELGSNFRLAAVFTDLPLVPDAPRDVAAEDFCTRCQVCVDGCPVDAISNEKQMVRGVMKWYVDFDRCLPYFNEHLGCGICLAVCPWSAPGRSPKLTDKMMRRRLRRSEGADPDSTADAS